MSQQKKPIITGASSGIGAELALQLTKKGHHVYLLARRQERLQQIQEIIQKKGGSSEIIACDVSQKKSVVIAFNEILAQTDNIDSLILNAGIGLTSLSTTKENIIEKVIQTNFLGMVYCIHQLLPLFKKQKKRPHYRN